MSCNNLVLNKKRERSSPGEGRSDLKRRQADQKMGEKIGNMSMDQLMECFSSMLDEKLRLMVTKDDIQLLSDRIVFLEEENLSLRKQVESLRTSCKKYESKMEDLEGRSRRNNVIFRGIENINGNNCISKVRTFCAEILGVTDIAVNRAHTLGRENKAIIAHLPWDEDINRIFENVNKLKNTGFIIHRDYTWETRRKRHYLSRLKKEIITAAGNGTTVYMGYDFIRIQGVKFFWKEGKKLWSDAGDGIQKLKSLLRIDLTKSITELERDMAYGRKQQAPGPARNHRMSPTNMVEEEDTITAGLSF